MTDLRGLRLTINQAEALQHHEVTEIEQITGDVLAKIDGRIRNGIAAKVEQWKVAQEPPAEPPSTEEAPKPMWHDRSFGERVAEIRDARSYIRKVMADGMDYSAVRFDDLLDQVRDLFLEWGVSWHTAATHVIESRVHEFRDMLVMEDLIVFTFRFQCVEGSESPSVGSNWYRDIQVPARSFDVYDPCQTHPQGDKGPGKAHTYGQKLALRTFLNLPAGDDPDFTPAASLGTRARALRDERVDRLRRALEKTGVKDIEIEIKALVLRFNATYHRGVESIEDIDDQTLLKWCEHFEGKEKANGDS